MGFNGLGAGEAYGVLEENEFRRVVARGRLELPPAGPEPAMLPLHHRAIQLSD